MTADNVVQFDRGYADRTPPQDVPAEQSVLGAMLLSKNAIGEVTEIIKGRDFYRPAHEYIYEAVMDQYGRGEPADAITVADNLGKRGQLGQVGGHIYLHELVSAVSVTANAAYKHQLTDRAVDLVQLFATSGTKNGADIRLAIDAVEDLLRHSDITHVVIVGGDSDYIPLAQRCKRMGRFVVGIGVASSTSRALSTWV